MEFSGAYFVNYNEETFGFEVKLKEGDKEYYCIYTPKDVPMIDCGNGLKQCFDGLHPELWEHKFNYMKKLADEYINKGNSK